MEVKPELSKRIHTRTRDYFIDAVRDPRGKPYMAISEQPTKGSPNPGKKWRIFIFPEDLDRFAEAFSEVAEYISNEAKK